MSDEELLTQYTREDSSGAFQQLVERHLGLVYRIALRQVRSSALAEDVAQRVFTEFAASARRLPPETIVVAWLHVVARRRAIDAARTEARQAARREEYARMHAPTSSDVSSDPRDAHDSSPLLDEALASLTPTDRAAVLLRFYEGQSLHEVGTALRLSEDAAQKRVARAIERLRRFFEKRGLPASAAAVGASLAADAAPAPAGLVAAHVATFALKHAATITGLPSAVTFAMTITQKIVTAAVCGGLLGVAVWEATLVRQARASVSASEAAASAASARLAATERALLLTQEQLKQLTTELAAERAKAKALSSPDPAAESELGAWLERVSKLRDELARRPTLQIPEMQYATRKDWLDAAKEPALNSDYAIRRALSQLRTSAKQHVAEKLRNALQGFIDAHPETAPTDPEQLAAFLDPTINASLLGRYQFVTRSAAEASGNHWMFPDSGWALTERQQVDDAFDSTVLISTGGFGVQGTSRVDRALAAAYQAYMSAHQGTPPTRSTDVIPYLATPIDAALLEEKMNPKRVASR